MVGFRDIADTRDWRRDATYDFTRTLPRRGWAWEFLRRDPDYRRAKLRSHDAVERNALGPNLTVLTRPDEVHDLAKWGLIFRRFAGQGRH